jgi:acetylornithine deacetylase/succinyl-diaminopimelate desuccinylase-like protein
MTKFELESIFTTEGDRYLREWQELLAFPSVSIAREHSQDCRRCAEWLADHVTRLGFTARLAPTESHPVLLAERAGKPGAPVVLFYGHYDVQPVDPIDLWITPPFIPSLRNGRMYARGAQDNKGQCFAALKAIEALIHADQLNCTVKLVIEGDEEAGHMPILPLLERERTALKSDLVMAADTGTVASGAPTITMGLRGIAHLTVMLTGPDHDLHSGVHGGRAPNPALGMARLLASLHDASGRVAVPGFYDGVKDPTPEERRLANATPFDPAWYKSVTGTDAVAGELAYTPVERTGFRPTLEVNGIHSGYGGPGSKTIIPACAQAKLSARLVPGQQPEAILDLIATHLAGNVPRGMELRITERGIGGPAVRIDIASPAIRQAREVLGELAPLPTAFLWEGASIPILSHLPAIAGAPALLVGFGGEADNIHAPNESYSIEQFKAGFLYTGMFLSRFGR